MDRSLRAFLENNEFQNDEREQLIESIAAYKSRLKKMKQNYESMTPEKYEEDKQKLKTRIDKVEKKINDTVKLFQENLTVPADQPIVNHNEQNDQTVQKIKKQKIKTAKKKSA